jgi:hypothetical protein
LAAGARSGILGLPTGDQRSMAAQCSVAFLSFLVVFMANAARYSLREGVFLLPFATRLSRAREPRKFYAAVAVVACVSLTSFFAISGYLWKLVA